MSRDCFFEKMFEKTDFSAVGFASGDYENCVFNNCNFSGIDLSAIKFTESVFNSCNLSMVKLTKTALQDVKFKECKLLGLHFENCNDFLFSIDFDGCNLNFSSFYKKNIKNPF